MKTAWSNKKPYLIIKEEDQKKFGVMGAIPAKDGI
jgi:hypothetical protein